MARVLLFGPLRDVAGWRQRDIDGASVAELLQKIADADPRLAEAIGGPGVKVAIDQQVVHGDASLPPTAEVAFLPPMSGG